MSILNARSNQFFINFPPELFYPEIKDRWIPVIKRLKLPFDTVEDFINNCVQSISFPSVELPTVDQQQSQFQIKYRGGKELEPILDKNLTITFKLSEGFFSYWILFEQLEQFVNYEQKVPFWPSLYVSFLDNNGFEIVAFEFHKIVPTGLSPFSISYATTAAEFNTFTLSLNYNRFDIKRKLSKEIYTIGKSS